MPTIRVTDATTEPVDLARAKRHLREDLADAYNDQDIEALIKVARHAAEARLQRTLITTTWRHTRDAFPGAAAGECIRLPMGRVIAVTSITYVDENSTTQTMAADQYRVDTDSEPARITPAHGVSWPATQDVTGAVRVTYTAGYGATRAAVPVPIVQWILLALTDLYQQRGRSSDKPAVAQGFADGLLDAFVIYGADA